MLIRYDATVCVPDRGESILVWQVPPREAHPFSHPEIARQRAKVVQRIAFSDDQRRDVRHAVLEQSDRFYDQVDAVPRVESAVVRDNELIAPRVAVANTLTHLVDEGLIRRVHDYRDLVRINAVCDELLPIWLMHGDDAIGDG